MRNNNRDFAFGSSTVGDCQCPALTAGRSINETGVTETAEWYDKILGDKHGSRGVVDEETAKTAWLQMIEDIEAYYHDDGYTNWQATEARDIADELGWADEL